MKILYAASEAVPFVKSGGLADVAGALTKAIRNRQHACRVVLPLYADIAQEWRDQMTYVTQFTVPLGWRNQHCGVFELHFNSIIFYFIDNESYFKRSGLYGFYDDAERFAFFSKAILEMLLHIPFHPQIIHCNDWQTALVPVYLDAYYRRIAEFSAIQTVFTIHNIQYQGQYDLQVATEVVGLPPSAVSIVEYQNATNLMKGGIEAASAVTTVSPTYANEILDPWFGHGLDAFLRDRKQKLQGILNGIDYMLYNPETDPAVAYPYHSQNLEGKEQNKRALQADTQLHIREDTMLIAMVTRLVEHKGLDLVREAFDRMMEKDVQFIVLGSGEAEYEAFFLEMQRNYAGRVAVALEFNETLAHQIYSGADCFLMPSKSEPCGLAQMIAMRYGTIPIVRSTGGLHDSVRDFGGADGNGYDFQNYDAYDLLDAVQRAYKDFQDHPIWKKQMETVMQCDYSWGKSANQYIALYQSLCRQTECVVGQ